MGKAILRDDESIGPPVTKTDPPPSPRPEVSGTLTASPAPVPRLEEIAPAGPEARDVPPALLARYDIVSLLGAGGMGAVYRARDRQLHREVALKILLHRGAESAERMLREARAQARLDHENICKVFEAGNGNGVCHIAMQYIDGAPLRAAAEAMTLEEKVRVARQVALALHEAHRRGLVHRDVKPSNVMIGEGDDGARKPYLVDFGIARDAGEPGQTATGALAGTPAFMAPEQARGDVHALDRRTDVYGLGATLFDLLAGRPPFTAPSQWTLLRSILDDDAPPLRTLRPEIPADLEAIVARCLEKPPHRRYDSAKALADDLARFLDGDPVQARRLSPAYVLYRKARKHRIAVALAGAVLLTALIVVALWVRERRIEATHADLARALGEDVKEMELFLRTAYGLPLHDVEREKDIVRARLAGIAARMAALGKAGEGPGEYALGRGHLALQEPEEARAHLAKAIAAGYASPELDYAMGLALGELYDRAVVVAKRIDDQERQMARLAALAAEYAEPAARHLRAALAARLDAPEYVEGLIALREGRAEEALAKARAAFEKAPWLHEAKRLEGDAHFALGRRFGADAAFDYEKMMVDYRAAAEAYRAAGEIARSDPRVHEAACRLWAQIMLAAGARPETRGPSHEEAVAACGRAMAASSRGVSARIERGFVQSQYAWLLVAGDAPEDPGPIMDEAIALGTGAARLAPDEPMAPYVVAAAERAHALSLYGHGLDCRSASDRAIAAFRDALRLDPSFVWARNDLAGAYVTLAAAEGFRGSDPDPFYELAVEEAGRAAALDPRSIREHAIAAAALLFLAEHLVDVGRDPAAAITRARAEVEAGRTVAPDWPDAWYDATFLDWVEARHALAVGRDPEATLARGEAIARAEAVRSPGVAEAHDMLGKLEAVRAQAQLAAGGDPEPALDAARASFRRAAEAMPGDGSIVVWAARAEILRLRWAARTHEIDASANAAAAPLLALVATPQIDPRPAEALAEIHELVAASQVARGRPADRAIADGLARAREALALNPHLSSAFAVKGALLLLKARAAKVPAERRAAALESVQVFTAATKENPLLYRSSEPLLEAANAMLRE